MDACGTGLWAGLLQMCEDMNCWHNEVPDNVALHPIAFPSKSLSSTGQQHQKRSTCYTERALEVPPLLLCKQSTCHHWPQATGSHDQERCGNIVRTVTVHYVAHTPVQCAHPIQIRLWIAHRRLTVMAQCHGEDQEIPGMNVSIHAISTSVYVPVCTSTEDVKAARDKDPELQMLKSI